MDTIAEKFDVFDFFNLIIAGITFEIGLGFYDPSITDHLNSIKDWIGDSVFATILVISLFVVLSYITGAVFNTLGKKFLWNNVHVKMVRECLTNDKIVNNKEKLERYRSKAQDFFSKNKSKDENKDKSKNENTTVDKKYFTPDQNECYFAHCIYHIQAREQNKKSEKLRSVAGLSMLLTVCFAFLSFPIPPVVMYFYALLRHRFKWVEVSLGRQIITCIACIIFTRVFYFRYKNDESNHIRMVLAVYDVCKDMDKEQSDADHT